MFKFLVRFNCIAFIYCSKCFVHWTTGWKRVFWWAHRAAGSTSCNAVGELPAYHCMGNVGDFTLAGCDFCGIRIARLGRWTHGSADHDLFGWNLVGNRRRVTAPIAFARLMLRFQWTIYKRYTNGVRGHLSNVGNLYGVSNGNIDGMAYSRSDLWVDSTVHVGRRLFCMWRCSRRRQDAMI